jgi:hypothetical protein
VLSAEHYQLRLAYVSPDVLQRLMLWRVPPVGLGERPEQGQLCAVGGADGGCLRAERLTGTVRPKTALGRKWLPTLGPTTSAPLPCGVLDTGVNFLAKPFSIEQLGKMIGTILRQAERDN